MYIVGKYVIYLTVWALETGRKGFQACFAASAK